MKKLRFAQVMLMIFILIASTVSSYVGMWDVYAEDQQDGKETSITKEEASKEGTKKEEPPKEESKKRRSYERGN